MMKVVVVGSRGFIGQHLTSSFGEDSVLQIKNNAEYKQITDSRDERLLDSDLIVWAASKVVPANNNFASAAYLQERSDWNSLLNLLQLKKYKGRIIYLSSGGCTYSGSKLPFSENDVALGINAYGAHKVAMENMLLQTNLNGRVLRIANVYGMGQKTGRGQGVIAEWVKCIETFTSPTIYGDLKTFRDYIHISDVVKAILIVSECDGPRLINIGSGEKTSLGKLLEIFQSVDGIQFNPSYRLGREFDRQGYVLDISLAREAFSWSPELDLLAGIKRTIRLR